MDEIRQQRLQRFAQLQNEAVRSEPKNADAAKKRSSNDDAVASVPSLDKKSQDLRAIKQSKPKPKPEGKPQSTHLSAATQPFRRQPADNKLEESELILRTFRVSLEPRNDAFYLEELKTVLGECSVTLDHLDDLIWEVLTHSSSLKGSVLAYLFECDSRLKNLARQYPASNTTIVAKIEEYVARYAVICSTSEDPSDALYGDLGLTIIGAPSEMPWPFINRVFSTAKEEGMLIDLVAKVFAVIDRHLIRVGFLGDYRCCLLAVENLLDIKDVVDALLELPNFHVGKVQASQIGRQTILGPLFALSATDADVRLKLFDPMQDPNKAQVSQILNNTFPEIDLIVSSLFNISNKILRSSTAARKSLLKYFSDILDKNKRRMAMEYNAEEVCSHGFMFNVLGVIVRFCEPFTNMQGTKINKISASYFRHSQAFSIADETKMNADREKSEKYFGIEDTSELNFITEIFFLGVGYLHYGLESIIQAQSKCQRTVQHLQSELASLEQRSDDVQMAPQHRMLLFQGNFLLKKVKAELYSQNVYLYHERSMQCFYEFASFVLIYVVNLAEPTHSFPMKPLEMPLEGEVTDEFACMPEFLVDSPAQVFCFVSMVLPQIARTCTHVSVVEALVFFLRCPQYIHNPYLKSKLVEILFYCSAEQQTTTGQLIPGSYIDIFNTNPVCLKHLLHALMMLYVDMEHTGRNSAFYDKFNTREIISRIMKTLMLNSIHRTNLERESKENSEFFVRFVALLLNDSTYLLDEALSKLQEISRLQHEIASGAEPDNSESQNDADETEDSSPEQQLASAESQAKLYLQLSQSTVSLLIIFTEAAAPIFLTPEIVDRFAVMLDYNLAALVGKRCRELKVKNPERYGFNPRILLSQIVRVYLNLGDYSEFIHALARDTRSYNTSNFDRVNSILQNILSTADAKKLKLIQKQADKARQDEEEADNLLGNVPDEFLDPLMFTLMENPVILPSSKVVVDLSTIKVHLLSNPVDPFNRAPLSIEDVIPDNDLKARIEAFKAERRTK